MHDQVTHSTTGRVVRWRRRVRIDGEDYVVDGASILGIIIVRQTGHSKVAGRGGSSPGARGSVAEVKDPGRNFLHLWHHHSNFDIVSPHHGYFLTNPLPPGLKDVRSSPPITFVLVIARSALGAAGV